MFKKSLPLMVIAGLTALFIGFDLHSYLSFEQLKTQHLWLHDHVVMQPLLSA